MGGDTSIGDNLYRGDKKTNDIFELHHGVVVILRREALVLAPAALERRADEALRAQDPAIRARPRTTVRVREHMCAHVRVLSCISHLSFHSSLKLLSDFTENQHFLSKT